MEIFSEGTAALGGCEVYDGLAMGGGVGGGGIPGPAE